MLNAEIAVTKITNVMFFFWFRIIRLNLPGLRERQKEHKLAEVLKSFSSFFGFSEHNLITSLVGSASSRSCSSYLPTDPPEVPPVQSELELRAGSSGEGTIELGAFTTDPGPVLAQMWKSLVYWSLVAITRLI